MQEILVNSVVQALSGLFGYGELKTIETVIRAVVSQFDVSQNHQEDPSKQNEEYLDLFLSAKQVEGCSEKSIDYYRKTIQKMLDQISKPVIGIMTDDLRSYLSDYQKLHGSSKVTIDNSKVTIDNIRRIISSFFSWLEEEDHILKSPARRIHKIKTDKVIKDTYSDEELEKMRDSTSNSRDLAMIDLLASTGMRVGELVKLNIDDVDLTERECIVFGKGNKERPVYFDARTKLHLSKYLSERVDGGEALFVGLKQPYARLTINGVESRLKTIGEGAGITKVHPHKFRRTMATTAIDKGMPVEQLQKLLGHERIDTTMQYAMVKQSNVKSSHRRCIG